MKYYAVATVKYSIRFGCLLQLILFPYRHLKDNFKMLLAEMPQKHRAYFPLIFDSKGLRFHIDHLHEITQYSLYRHASKPLVELAKYADYTCVNFDKDNMLYMLDLLDQDSLEAEFHNINATSLGNLAHIALHYPEPMRSKAARILDRIRYELSEMADF